MRAKPFLIGLSTGIIGGLTAIIFSTPQSGNELRSNVARNLKIAKTRLSEIQHHSSSVKESIITLKNEAKNNIPNIMNDLKGSISNFRQEIGSDTEKLKEEIEGLQRSIAEIENNLSEINNNKKKE
ncbi:YtxH domain-containing protein [Lysinibacillus halotolerans]|uniref:YtxH domain-containing protein n=1 Tax=Lysinibacillus halotolerans TaxID=1368476 RepID=A0A3M8HF12_9BACI|nr:YtxH domain-containing protein [Lysinibacillus halotolerans]RND00977.1 YtxH domain-containing protein [Lysinibacillus halotolerans]